MTSLLVLATTLADPVAAAPPSYRVARVALPDGSVGVARWDACRPITYRTNLAAVPRLLRPGVAADVDGALMRLSQASGLRFRSLGSTTAVPKSLRTVAHQSADVVIAVTTPERTAFPLGDGVLGYGGYVSSRHHVDHRGRSGSKRWRATIDHGFTVLDLDAMLSLVSGFGPGLSRGNLLLHELGHVVGLEHVRDPGQVMAGTLSNWTPPGYGPGDLAGLRLVGAGGGCAAAVSTPALSRH